MSTREFPKSIADALVADGTVNGFISGRVYMRLAPASVAYPYIVIALSAGVSVNDSPGEPKDNRYIVRAVSPSQTIAAQVAEAIYDALHHASLTLDGWKLLQVQHESEFDFVEGVERDKLFHLGGIYRIRANK